MRYPNRSKHCEKVWMGHTPAAGLCKGLGWQGQDLKRPEIGRVSVSSCCSLG